MIEQTTIEHHIQKHIVNVLMFTKLARFRDLRPPKTDTNLFSYHLKILLKNDFVQKVPGGYSLGKRGVLYIDRVTTSTLTVRTQPKIITMLVVQNSDGQLLIYRRQRQPWTDQWTLPYGKLHIDDESLEQSAKREASEKLGLDDYPVVHAGDCYIRIRDKQETVMSTLVHVFRLESDDIRLDERQLWVKPHQLHEYDLAPAVENIVARTFFRDPYFFEEFEEEWKN